MFIEIFLHQLKSYFKKKTTYIYFFVFLILSFLLTITFGNAFNNVYSLNLKANSPYTIFTIISTLSYLGIILNALIMSKASISDYKYNVYNYYFTYPIRKKDYILGKYSAALTALIFIFFSMFLGAIIGSQMPFVDSSKFIQIRFWAYIQPYLILVIPNLIFIGSIFFTLGLLLRKESAIYTSSIVLFILFSTVANFKNTFFTGLVHPMGTNAVGMITKYWTVAEKNKYLIPLRGVFLYNRILWILLGILVIISAYYLFDFCYPRTKNKNNHEEGASSNSSPISYSRIEFSKDNFSFVLKAKQFFRSLIFQFRWLVKNIYFYIIILVGILYVAITGFTSFNEIFGTTIYPVTYEVLNLFDNLNIVFILLITYLSGKLFWRNRDNNFNEVVDSLPGTNTSFFFSQVGAIILSVVVFQIILIIAGIFLQIIKGYYNFNLGLYFQELFLMELPKYIIFCILALAVHSLIYKKYLSYFIIIILTWVNQSLPQWGLEHNIYQINSDLGYKYSDMNGYGSYLFPYYLFKSYWFVFALILAFISILLWVRGKDNGFRFRIKKAFKNLNARKGIVLLILIMSFIGLASVIFFNTNIKNDFKSNQKSIMRKVKYEKKFSKFKNFKQPTITKINLKTDIFPNDKKLHIKGTYNLKNKSDKSITRLFIDIKNTYESKGIKINRKVEVLISNKNQGVFLYKIKKPLKPNDEVKLNFKFKYNLNGFNNEGVNNDIVKNGTFFKNRKYLPSLGFNNRKILKNANKRKKYGLKDIREAFISNNQMINNIANNSDWIDFEVTVSTNKNQTAIAPGKLKDKWVKENRKYFKYELNEKMVNYYPILSANYKIKKERWKDTEIKILYHKSHHYNIKRMIKALKKSLTYYSNNFGEYPHKEIKIVEFPRYEYFAQSFPTTIPISEGLGFIAKIEKNNVDYLTQIIAHEVAHQWWGHQVLGADKKGSKLLSETLAQYSSLMVMKKKYNEKVIRKYLEYQLDNYFKRRGNEDKKEQPLLSVKDNQQYIYYNKGIIVMNILANYIGEENLNNLLSKFYKNNKYKNPPYPDSKELIEYLKKNTPNKYKYLIKDLFQTIIFYENKALKANYQKIDENKYKVILTVKAKKLRIKRKGKNKKIDISDWIDIGVFGKNGKKLYFKKHKINSNNKKLIIVVNHKPVKAGIDPNHILIDKNIENNIIKTEKLPTHFLD